MTPTAVVDTSALVAIMTDEDDAAWFVTTIRSVGDPVISAGSLQEFVHVLTARATRREPVASATRVPADALTLLDALGIGVADVTPQLAVLGGAASALLHASRARLNFGDGFAYALARHLDCPIICKGADFPATDIDVLQPPTTDD